MLLLVVFVLLLFWLLVLIIGNEVWKEKVYLFGMVVIVIGVFGVLWVCVWLLLVCDVWVLCGFGVVVMFVMMLFMVLWFWCVLYDGVMLMFMFVMLCLLVGMVVFLFVLWYVCGFGWFESWGCLSYEIYFIYMFVVFGVVCLWCVYGGDLWVGFWWYLLMLVVLWVLGWLLVCGFL